MVEPHVVPTRDAVGLTDVESEHALQYTLLTEAERLIDAMEGAAARDVVQQLYNYSEAHFASEQVLMRLHSYPGYFAHEREHGELLAALRILLTSLPSGDSFREAGLLRRWLTTHIHHSDQAFLDFMQSSGVSSRVNSQG